MPTLSETLEKLMDGMSESSLAIKVNLPKATINRLLSGRTPDPRASTLLPIAQYFGISVEQLLGNLPLSNALPIKSLTNKISTNTVQLPLVSLADLSVIKKIEYTVQVELNSHDSLFVTQVDTNAMFPKFPKNSFLLVSTDTPPESGHYVISQIADKNACVFRQFEMDGEDKMLVPINQSYPAITMTKSDKIIGVVIESKNLLI